MRNFTIHFSTLFIVTLCFIHKVQCCGNYARNLVNRMCKHTSLVLGFRCRKRGLGDELQLCAARTDPRGHGTKKTTRSAILSNLLTNVYIIGFVYFLGTKDLHLLLILKMEKKKTLRVVKSLYYFLIRAY